MDATLTTSTAGGAQRRASSLLRFLAEHRTAFYAFAASRLVLFVIGLLTQILIEPASSKAGLATLTDSAALRMWGQWDSGWYVGLGAEGYSPAPSPDGQVNWAFFPAFPMLSAGLARLTGLSVFAAMVALANLSFLGALLLVHRLARREFDPRTADIAVVLLCAAPGSYIFSAAYTESLFLLALTACLLMLRARRWLAAGCAAALAVLTRNLGIGLLLSFGFAAAPLAASLGGRSAKAAPGAEVVRAVAGAALPILALAGFCVFLWRLTGDPFAFATAQKGWDRTFEFPLLRVVEPLLDRRLAADDAVSFAAAWLSLAMLVALAAMRRWSLLALGCFLTLVPLSAGLTSYARYSLVALPIVLAGARLLAARPAAAGATIVAFATLNGFLMAAWTLGLWIAV